MLLLRSTRAVAPASVAGARGRASPRRAPGACGRPRSSRSARLAVRAAQEPEQFGLAPAKPKTPYGEMLQYYLRMEPQLFRAAVDQQLARLKAEADARAAAEEAAAAAGAADADGPDGAAGDGGRSKSELVLYRRMEEVRAMEVAATLEDLMYVSILEKFVVLGVEMLPRLDGFVDAGPANLVALTEGIHSKEALELVREHMLGVMGAAASAKFSTELIKMSKFQMAQVYAASIMFGYFLRRVDRRFQLEAALGVLEPRASQEEAVARLERLFAQADDLEASTDPDSAGPLVDVMGSDEEVELEDNAASGRAGSGEGASSSGRAGEGGEGAQAGGEGLPPRPRGPVRSASSHGRSALRRYIEGFDQATMIDTARVVSAEGAALVERQTTALFGDIKALTQQMQEAVGQDVSSAEELYARIQAAVQGSAIETVTMTIATQRRCVLEAVAFGTFLRDVETGVTTEYGLLTPLPPPKLPPGAGGGGDDDE
ncbi:UV-B-induced protein [Scenedesmus sp. PABB004]|nr:UV-B-induced protein [Scenedesmus sp. PABB004]